jgi:hypothetical protein
VVIAEPGVTTTTISASTVTVSTGIHDDCYLQTFHATLNSKDITIESSTRDELAPLSLKGSGSKFVAKLAGANKPLALTTKFKVLNVPKIYSLYFEVAKVDSVIVTFVALNKAVKTFERKSVDGVVKVSDEYLTGGVDANAVVVILKPQFGVAAVEVENLYMKACLKPEPAQETTHAPGSTTFGTTVMPTCTHTYEEAVARCRCTMTCEMLKAGKTCADWTPVMGPCCACSAGFIYNSEGKCVRESECTCTDTDETKRAIFATYTVDDGKTCAETCVFSHHCVKQCVKHCSKKCQEGYKLITPVGACCQCVIRSALRKLALRVKCSCCTTMIH